MINPATKALNLALLPFAASLPAIPAFNFAGLAQAYPFSVASACWGLTQAQYNHLFIPDVSDVDGVCGPDQAPTLTTSSAKSVASNMTKFVNWFQTQF